MLTHTQRQAPSPVEKCFLVRLMCFMIIIAEANVL